MPPTPLAEVSAKGAARWAGGHPWIFRSDVTKRPESGAGVIRVVDNRQRALGWALWSPASEISLRLIDPDPDARIDDSWWFCALQRAVTHRAALDAVTNAYRLVHGEGDALPSLVCDRYDRWLVLQTLSAGLVPYQGAIVDALVSLTGAQGVLARNDASVRAREGLPRETVLVAGDVPQQVEVHEHGVRYLAAPWTGQKTGAFLDQRENRVRVANVTRGRALDCFSYHGSFALHLAKRASTVVAVDSSADALVRARANAALNGASNLDFVEANAFDYLRDALQRGNRFDTVVVDPPAFAKTKASLGNALRGYHDINVNAMKVLAPGGWLFSASCSYHLTKALFLEMLVGAAADSGRRLALREVTGQPSDHPEILTIPESGYLKGALLQSMD